MRVILSDKKLDDGIFPSDVHVAMTTYKGMNKYDNNSEVVAIVGSRAMAIKANQLKLPNLKFIQLTSAGYEGVPVQEFLSKDIIVANAGNIYSTPIAETVVLGMLLMAKKLHRNPNNRHAKIQRHYIEIQELYTKKTMILGAGSIGTEVAKRLAGFGMAVDGYARSSGERPYFNRVISGQQELAEEIRNYDYVVSTLPDSEDTRGFFDKELLGKMKRTSVIVNVGRKAVFKEDDLFTALRTKSIGGAVLDMFEIFPNPITNKFRRLQNVIVFPGVSAISREAEERLYRYTSQNVSAAISGKKISNIVEDQ